MAKFSEVNSDLKQDVNIIIPAAGSGTRCKVDPPKQFQLLNNRPIISHTISLFENLSFVKTIVVITPPDMLLSLKMKNMLNMWKHKKVIFCEGSFTRHRSIFRGLTCLKDHECNSDSVVIIHDGVRPFVDSKIIFNIVKYAAEYNAAGIVCPSVSTVVSINGDGFLDQVLDRTKYFASEMPQGFKFNVVFEAYAKCSESELDCGTECLKLIADHTGVCAKMLKDDGSLWKITYPRDLLTAKHYAKRYVLNNTIVHSINKACDCDLIRKIPDVNIQQLARDSLDEKFFVESNSNFIFVSNSETDLMIHTSSLLDVASRSIAKEKRPASPRSIVFLLCCHASDTDFGLEFPRLRQFTKQRSEELSNAHVFLYAIVMAKKHYCDASLHCIRKLVGDEADVAFNGQLFYF